jgi:hypothetical protein
LAGALVPERDAEACTCASVPPPCRAYYEAAAVFVGEVVELTGAPADPGDQGQSSVPFGSVARFRVARAYRGLEAGAPSAVVTTAGTLAECGYPFAVGGSYLVYAYRRAGEDALRTATCTRTRPPEAAGEDLEYIEYRAKGDTPGTVSGTVMRYEVRAGGYLGYEDQPSGVTLGLRGAAVSLEAQTGDGGAYVFTGVPPGTYRLRVRSAGTLVNSPELKVIVGPGECVNLDLHMTG